VTAMGLEMTSDDDEITVTLVIDYVMVRCFMLSAFNLEFDLVHRASRSARGMVAKLSFKR
jgi:hypothetical protein